MNESPAQGRPRVLVVGLKQETSVFSPTSMTLADFEVLDGPQVREQLQGTETEIGGIIDVADTAGLDLRFGTAAWAPSGGVVEEEAWGHLSSQILRDVAAAEVDGVIAVLHGSMVTQTCEDPEGWLLGRIRELIGRMPLYATLDLHAVLTEAMTSAADVMFPYHTYPHTDHAETGRRSARAMARALSGRVSPVTAVVRVPLLVRGDELLTRTGEYGRLIDRCIDAETHQNVIAAGILIGNPFTDVPELASNVLITTNGDPGTARRLSLELAQELWDRRELFVAHLTPIDDLPDLVGEQMVTIIADQADATSSGSTGDSVSILDILHRRCSHLSTVVPLVDGPAVTMAMETGVGGDALFTLGGTIDKRNSRVTLQAKVIAIFVDSIVRYEDGTTGSCGDTAVLRADGIEILVTSRTAWFVGKRIFTEHGISLDDKRIIVVKSPNGFRTHYEAMADRIIVADGEGCTTANLLRLPYSRVVRPIHPLDKMTDPGLTVRLVDLTT